MPVDFFSIYDNMLAQVITVASVRLYYSNVRFRISDFAVTNRQIDPKGKCVLLHGLYVW